MSVRDAILGCEVFIVPGMDVYCPNFGEWKWLGENIINVHCEVKTRAGYFVFCSDCAMKLGYIW